MSDSRQHIANIISQIARSQIDVRRLDLSQLESVTAEIFAQNMMVTNVQRALSSQADMLLSVRNGLNAIATYAIQITRIREQLSASAVKDFAKALDGIEATKGILVSASKLSEAARAVAAQHNWRVELIDGDRLQDLAKQYLKTQEDFAASLAFRIRGLETREFGRLGSQTPESVETVDTEHLHVPPEYAQLIVRADRLPFRVIRDILSDPRHMHDLTPRQFEEFIAEIVERLGFGNVILTPRSGDGGRDVIASKEVKGIPLTFYFECKKRTQGNKVQLDTLRALLGSVAHDARKANIGVLVTTSQFTRGCKQLIASECRLDGKDYEGILGWIQQLNVQL